MHAGNSKSGGSGGNGAPDYSLCTTLTCLDQFVATVTVDVAVVPAGTHTVEVSADLYDTSCTFALPPATSAGSVTQCTGSENATVAIGRAVVCPDGGGASACQIIDEQFLETITLLANPTSVHVRQLVGGAVILDQTVSPTYQVLRPNGPDCPPLCDQASAAWTIP